MVKRLVTRAAAMQGKRAQPRGEEPDEYLPRLEVASLMRKPVATLARWSYQGQGPPYYRLGRGVVYRRAEVEAWIEAQRVDPAKRAEETIRSATPATEPPATDPSPAARPAHSLQKSAPKAHP